MKNKINSRRFKHGSLATVITILVIVGLVLVNVIATTLLERYPLNIDLTKDKRFALTDESKDYLKGINKDIKIIVCADEATFENSGEVYKQAYEIIKNYEKYSKKIKIEFVDLSVNPTFAQKYPDEKLAIGDIIVESNLRMKKFSSSDFFSSSQSQMTGETKYLSKAEQVMTASLMYVTDDNPSTISLLTGVDAVDVSGYVSLLESNNYQVVKQDLLTDSIDEKADFVILPQPAVDLTSEQVNKLNDYLDNNTKFGKSVVFIPSTTTVIGPILESFLADWGIQIGNEIIAETNNNYAVGNYFGVINEIGNDDFKAKLKKADYPIVTPYARPITALFTEKDNRSTIVYTKTSSDAILVPANADENFDATKQQKNSYNTIVNGKRRKYDGTTPLESNVLVIGSEQMLSETLLKSPGYGNGDAIITATNLLTNKKDTIKIVPVEFSTDKITITDAQVSGFKVVLVIIIPILILVSALVVFLRRRHL